MPLFEREEGNDGQGLRNGEVMVEVSRRVKFLWQCGMMNMLHQGSFECSDCGFKGILLRSQHKCVCD